MAESESIADVTIIGAGAAGLATAIFAARASSKLRIVAMDGAKRLGAKILVSGGGRCNVTNRTVTTADFFGGNRNIVKKLLAAFSAERSIAFFAELGVALHEEPRGKLFPDSNDASTVAAALIGEARRLGVLLLTDHRVTAIERTKNFFAIHLGSKQQMSKAIVLCTGGLSLPKTGSDGVGYVFAKAMGHSIVPTTPALAPLVLDGGFHVPLSGISLDVELTIRTQDEKPVHMDGPILWTHFGISGPIAMDASRFWHRAKLENRSITISANLLPGKDFDSLEKQLLARAQAHPRGTVAGAFADHLPVRMITAILSELKIMPQTPLAHLMREDRRRLIQAIIAWPLPIRDSRGYTYAEVTAGGVPLEEIDPATMQSRKCPGLYFAGEILNVDGRIGGFNFQWAWATGFVAGQALGKTK